MPFFNVHKSNQGFTLPEVLIIVVIVGILAAVAVPSFLGWYSRQKVNQALTQVQGALKEAQREAIKKSKSCTVTLNANIVTGPCLVTGDRDLNGVALRRPNTMSLITFDFKGETGNTGTVVLAMPNVQQKCLVLAPGIGLMRTGNYADSDRTGNSAGNCATSQ